MICPTGEAKYFCKRDSTQKCPTGKSPRRREQIPLVLRTRRSAFRAAPQSRDPQLSERHDGPRLSSTPLRAALRPGNAVAPLEVYQTCLMKESGGSTFPSCVPDAVQRSSRCSAEPGPILTVAGWTPAQQRTAARCAASGERRGTAGGLSDVFDEGIRWEHISPVSRTRCNVLHVAPQSRDPNRHVRGRPGSAAARRAGCSPTGPRRARPDDRLRRNPPSLSSANGGLRLRLNPGYGLQPSLFK
jgi:hypothetical protein